MVRGESDEFPEFTELMPVFLVWGSLEECDFWRELNFGSV